MVVAAGCSQLGDHTEQQQANERWTARQQALLGYNAWNLRARAAIRLQGEAHNIGLSWQRQTEKSTILLEAPFGQGVFRIETDVTAGYRLQLPDGRTFENKSAEALLENMVGWSIPISGLKFWIRGLPRPGSAYTPKLDQAGRARSINQDHWIISYPEYFDAEEAVPSLPRRIRLVSDKVTFKLIIEHWQQPSFDVSPAELFPSFN